MNATDLAKKMNVSVPTFYRLKKNGVIPKPKNFNPFLKHQVLEWDDAEIESWLAEKKQVA